MKRKVFSFRIGKICHLYFSIHPITSSQQCANGLMKWTSVTNFEKEVEHLQIENSALNSAGMKDTIYSLSENSPDLKCTTVFSFLCWGVGAFFRAKSVAIICDSLDINETLLPYFLKRRTRICLLYSNSDHFQFMSYTTAGDE